MALPVEDTLGAVRIEVLKRLGFADQGTAVLRNVNLIDSWIRQSTKMMVHKAEWSSMSRSLLIPLTVGQDRYDFPDETDICQIGSFWIVDDQGRRWEMFGGLRFQDFDATPDDTTLRVATGQPERWGVIDGEIRILPAPTETFVNIDVYYISRLPKLIEDKELMPFDTELITQQAVLLGKIHYGMVGVSEARRELMDYLKEVRRQQREPRQFFVGGRKSHFITRAKETNGFRHKSDQIGRNAPWSPGWNPWF